MSRGCFHDKLLCVEYRLDELQSSSLRVPPEHREFLFRAESPSEASELAGNTKASEARSSGEGKTCGGARDREGRPTCSTRSSHC